MAEENGEKKASAAEIIQGLRKQAQVLNKKIETLEAEGADQEALNIELASRIKQLGDALFVTLSFRLDDLSALRQSPDEELAAEAQAQFEVALQLQSVAAPDLFAEYYKADPETGEPLE